jgi:hypothetical protein
MNSEWSLQAQVFEYTHRWYLPFLAFLLGSLLGWGYSKYIPTHYRAETSLSVTFSDDLTVRNPDDFKNSQMAELNLFILSRDVTSETLDRLRKRDPYWNQVSVRQIEANLNTYWRNTGVWRLVAEDADPLRALELAQAWGQVANDKIQVALFHADHLMQLQTQYETISRRRYENAQRITELDQIHGALQSWRENALTTEDDAPIDPLERMRLEYLTARAVNFDPAGYELLGKMPVEESPRHAYVAWLDQVLVYTAEERSAVNKQQSTLLAKNDETYQSLEDALKASQGLTAQIQVKPLFSEGQGVKPVRDRSDTALIGGLVGLIVWGLLWLAWPAFQSKR